MDEISEKIFNEELNKLFLVKIQIRKDFSWLSTAWRSRIWNEEIQNAHCSIHSVSLNLKDDNCWKPINGQIKLNEHLCSELEMKNRLHQECYARSCQETEELRRRCYKDENGVTQQKLNEYSLQQDQESRTVSLFFYDPDLMSSHDVPTFLIKLLLPRAQEAQPRSWNAAKYERIWVFLETFLIVNMLDETWWSTQWSKKFGSIIGVSEKRRNWEKGEWRTIATNAFTLLFGKAKEKVWTTEIVLCLWLTMPWVLGLVLEAWQFRVISPRRCICKQSLTKRNFKAGSWISKLKFAQKRRISRLYCSGPRDRSNKLAEGLHQSKINYGKIFLWLWRIGFDDGGIIEMMLRYCLFDLRNCRA